MPLIKTLGDDNPNYITLTSMYWVGTYHVLIAKVRAENKTEKVSFLMEFTFC